MEILKNSYEKRVQNQFGGFCIKVLKNEARRIHNEYTKIRENEKSFSDLTNAELAQLTVTDSYFSDECVFSVLGNEIVVSNSVLANAIRKLPDKKRDVILLSYFLDMSDTEISKQLNTLRQTISKRRKSTLWQLKELLKKEGYLWHTEK